MTEFWTGVLVTLAFVAFGAFLASRIKAVNRKRETKRTYIPKDPTRPPQHKP